jgi:hypothetical protein
MINRSLSMPRAAASGGMAVPDDQVSQRSLHRSWAEN